MRKEYTACGDYFVCDTKTEYCDRVRQVCSRCEDLCNSRKSDECRSKCKKYLAAQTSTVPTSTQPTTLEGTRKPIQSSPGSNVKKEAIPGEVSIRHQGLIETLTAATLVLVVLLFVLLVGYVYCTSKKRRINKKNKSVSNNRYEDRQYSPLLMRKHLPNNINNMIRPEENGVPGFIPPQSHNHLDLDFISGTTTNATYPGSSGYNRPPAVESTDIGTSDTRRINQTYEMYDRITPGSPLPFVRSHGSHTPSSIDLPVPRYPPHYQRERSKMQQNMHNNVNFYSKNSTESKVDLHDNIRYNPIRVEEYKVSSC